MSLSEDDWGAVRQFLSDKDYVLDVDNEPTYLWIKTVTILTENNGWAIAWMNNRYYIRHQACGGYLLRQYKFGCLCRTGKRYNINGRLAPVDDMILKKFKLVTKGEI